MFLPPLSLVQPRKPYKPNQYFVYQFHRAVTCQIPPIISGLTNAKRIDCPQTPCCRTTKHTTIENLLTRPPAHSSTKAHVISGDTVDCTQEIVPMAKASGRKVAGLNMTHPKRPGSSWKNGELSQEAALFLRTGLSRGLYPSHCPLKTLRVFTPVT